MLHFMGTVFVLIGVLAFAACVWLMGVGGGVGFLVAAPFALGSLITIVMG